MARISEAEIERLKSGISLQRLAEARHYAAPEAGATSRVEEVPRPRNGNSIGRGVLGWLRAAF